jgi:hypothetical protein
VSGLYVGICDGNLKGREYKLNRPQEVLMPPTNEKYRKSMPPKQVCIWHNKFSLHSSLMTTFLSVDQRGSSDAQEVPCWQRVGDVQPGGSGKCFGRAEGALGGWVSEWTNYSGEIRLMD